MPDFFRIGAFLSFFIVFHQGLLAQVYPCGTDSMVQVVLEAHPELVENRKRLEEHTRNFHIARPDTGAANYIIPVVFHIIHNYGNENLSRQTVEDALDILNEDMRGYNSDTASVIPAFKSIVADSEIEFRLARIAPDGQCTSGITRTVSGLTEGAGENVKDLISWNTDRYLNVWVVRSIGIGAAGYAFYPGTAPSPANEGIVMRAASMGYRGSNPLRTLTHEVGHYLNLAHVWGNSNNVNQSTSCGTDDNVSDTPLTIGTPQNCDLSRATCNSLDNVQNYMDYSSCRRMFTNGQKNRMHAALGSFIGGRNNLWTSANLVATGTNDGYMAQCPPIADFESDVTFLCSGESVIFTDLSYNDTATNTWTWTWSFPGGTPTTSTQQNPTVIYNTPGSHAVTLTVSNPAGQSSVSRNFYIDVQGTGNPIGAPFYEGIEYELFPEHPSDPGKDWTVVSGNTTRWRRNTAASFTGSASLWASSFNTPIGSVHSLITPPIDLGALSQSEATLSFWVAYAQSSSNSSDALKMFVSTDCGESWILRYLKAGQNLATSGISASGVFFPEAWEWRQERPYIGSYAGQVIQLKFELTSGGGSYVFLDNINLGNADSTDTVIVGLESLVTNPLSVIAFPNPGGSETYIQISGSMNAVVDIELREISGRLVAQKRLGLSNSDQIVPLREIWFQPTNGVYLITVRQGAETRTTRLMLSNW